MPDTGARGVVVGDGSDVEVCGDSCDFWGVSTGPLELTSPSTGAIVAQAVRASASANTAGAAMVNLRRGRSVTAMALSWSKRPNSV